MAERKEDDIMAEYLLKGGKMLEKTCRTCGCPQFEYKGKTFCVVCAEREAAKKEKKPVPAGQKPKTRSPAAVAPDSPTGTAGGAGSTLESEVAGTVLNLCRRIRDEEDPDRCLVLMDGVRTGTEALRILRQL